jgi:hypothetical protein
MWELQNTWPRRVFGALLLASLLQMSDGTGLWARTIPSVLGVGAIALAIVMIVARRRASGSV